jgi:phospholipid/cholesterol/gamma-HCH transport system substrate-binding protein
VSARRRSRKHEIRVGLLLLVSLVVFGWMAIQVGAMRGFGKTVTVTVVFDDAAGLVKDSSVKVAGVEVGSVQHLQIDFDQAVATLLLNEGAGLRRDVRAQVRARSLLGEKYVALFPVGRDAPLLIDGDTIGDTAPAVEIDDLLAALGPVLSRVDPDDVARIVHNAAELSDQLGSEGPVLLASSKQLLDRLNEAAEVAPAIKRDVPALLTDLRRTVKDLEATIEHADGLMGKADDMVVQLETATADIPGAVTDVRRILEQVEPGADDLARALEQSDDAVEALREVLANLEAFDEEMVLRLMREEGVLVRLKASKSEKIEKN